MTHPMHYIADNAALQQAGEYWLTLPALGIDTEFIRTDTFHPIPALIQISDGQQCWLVDVLHVQDFLPLKSVLVKPSIIKIVHAASEDLEVFDRLFGVLPDALFDTQIAASFCGHGSSIGYSKLVQAILDVEISKDQCRSDWLARPLTEEQTHYAGLDVLYLPALHQHLHNLLAQKERLDWAEEENLRQIARYREQRDASYNIDRINNAWRLDETERQRLWHLLLGRDALARQHNKPRNHIAKDFALHEMARRPPKHVAELSAIEGFKPSGIRQFGAHLIQLAQDVPADLICPIIAEPLGRAESARMKQLRACVDSLAASMDLPVEILVRKQELEQLVRHHANQQDIQLPARFTGWRDTVISQPLLDEINAW
jgi:ribonuclease D